MLLFIPWPILIDFVRKDVRDISISALGIHFVLLLTNPFFFLSVLDSIYLSLFSCSRLQTEQVRISFRDSEPWNRIWLSLFLSTLASALLSSPLPFAPWFYSYVFFYPPAIHLSRLQKSSEGMSVFFFAMEARIMGGETLWRSPKGKGKPCRTINSKSCTQDIFQGAKMESLNLCC